MQKPTQSPKPILPIQKRLRLLWVVWLLYRLLLYPLLVAYQSTANVLSGMLWQLLVLLPAFLVTPTVLKGRIPYQLLIANMVTLIYLASTGVFLVIRLYEHAPVAICLGFALESMLLLWINWYVFVLLKRLPPMHKTQKNAQI